MNVSGDVILFDPSDEQYSTGFNVLSAHSDLEKTCSGVGPRVSVSAAFDKLGDQMGSVLQNAILAFWKAPGRDARRLAAFLLDSDFRRSFLQNRSRPGHRVFLAQGVPPIVGQ